MVPAGDNSAVNFAQAGKTFWFAPGIHTLGKDPLNQIKPASNSSFIGAPGAIIDGQGINRYAFNGNATNVTIQYLTIQNFGGPGSNKNEGVVNHNGATGWVISHNTIQHNGGAGVFVGSKNRVSYNCLNANGQYGFSMHKPTSGELHDITLDHNEIVGNNTDDWETRTPGCGCTGGGKFWDAHDVQVINNYVHHNKGVGLWADTNNYNFLIQGNWIEGNDRQAIFYEISYNAAIRYNVIKGNVLVKGASRMASKSNFPDAAIYISESGGDSRVGYSLVGSATIDIANNLIQDNYNGVTLWENPDRFCNSPANTSTGYCTLVNPGVVTLSACNATNISQAPFFDDCRWKTQNVKVHDNDFRMNTANVLNCDTAFCGHVAIISNVGSSPAWSPYQGALVKNNITFKQGNQFSNNSYSGSWKFMPFDTATLINFPAWTTAPYNQDAGSTMP